MINKQSKPLIFLVYTLLFVGLATKKGALLALAIPFVGYLAVGLFFAPEKTRLEFERILSTDRVAQGIPLTVCLKITNQGTPIENLQVEDILPAGLQIVEGNSKLITSLKAGSTIELNYTLRGGRGYYHIPGFRITVSDHLGLIRNRENLTLSSRFLVLPEAYKLPEKSEAKRS